MLDIVSIDTPSLGDRSYLAHDGKVAVVVDPQRDIDRMLAEADAAGVRITHIFETHIHNDYVTGGYALARATGAAYHVNADDKVSFDRVAVRDGDVIPVGDRMRITVLATPGHTFTHLSFVLDEFDGTGWVTVGAFTGGSLLYGAVGRPDLLGPDHTHALARHQYASAQRIGELPDAAKVLPTHGFGSFCAVLPDTDRPDRPDAGDPSTVGAQRMINPALTRDMETFIEEQLAGLDAWPAYYVHMAGQNLAGPDPAGLELPARADAETVRSRLAAGEWVVDLRNRVAYAAGHLAGTLNIGLDGSFATYLGWLIPYGTPITLLADTEEQVLEARRELSRIGINPAAQGSGGPENWAAGSRLNSYPRATFADLAQVRHHRQVTVIDVRRNLEYTESHLDDVRHIPLHELAGRLDELPEGEVWVHCAAGYRAAIAASMLARHGRQVVHIDDDFANALVEHAGADAVAVGAPER